MRHDGSGRVTGNPHSGTTRSCTHSEQDPGRVPWVVPRAGRLGMTGKKLGHTCRCRPCTCQPAGRRPGEAEGPAGSLPGSLLTPSIRRGKQIAAVSFVTHKVNASPL